MSHRDWQASEGGSPGLGRRGQVKLDREAVSEMTRGLYLVAGHGCESICI